MSEGRQGNQERERVILVGNYQRCAFSEPCQTSEMERLAKIVKG